MNTEDMQAENLASTALASTLDQKREALEGAVSDAPQGRHQQEQAVLADAREQVDQAADPADRSRIDVFFRQQQEQLDVVQRTELDLAETALQLVEGEPSTLADEVDGLRILERAVDEIGSFHSAEHERLARERSELNTALSETDEARRGNLVDDLLQRQDDAGEQLGQNVEQMRFDAAFAERPGEPWTAQQEGERLAAGATDQMRRDPEAFVRDEGWKLSNRALDEALQVAVADDQQRRELSDLAADIRNNVEQTEGPQRRPELRYEEAERAGIRPAPRSSDDADIDNRLERGNFGERAATEWLAANGYQILDYKPGIEGTNKPGIDMIAMKDDTVYLLDNKALSRAGEVNSVSALTTNLEDRDYRAGNLTRAKDALRSIADDLDRSADEVALASKALDALQDGRYVLAVTNANVAHDDKLLSDVSDRLKESYDMEFIDVMRAADETRKRRY